jgi:hypothetical protein
MSNDLVVQLGAKLDQFQSDMNQAGNSSVSRIEQSFWIVRAALPGQTKASLAAFDDPEDAAAHVTWLVPRAVGKITTRAGSTSSWDD